MRHHMERLSPALCLLAACGTDSAVGEPAQAALEVNIQVTGTENVHEMMEELDERGIIATVWLSGTEMKDECEAVEAWAEKGNEIAGKYGPMIEEDTPREAQEDELAAIAKSSAECKAGTVVGFRANRFTANEDTYELLDEANYSYLERSARAERYSIYTFKPYLLEDHSVAVLPMPIVVYYGETSSMCDNACEDMMTPEDLLAYERKALDFHLATREPLIFEWHPGTTHPGDEVGWWGAFTGLLDHLQMLGDQVEFVTARQLVERHAQP